MTEELPPEWALVPFGEVVAEFKNGLSKRVGDEGAELNVLRLADINGGAISPDAPRAIRLTDEEAASYRLTPGDVVVIRVNGSHDLVGRFIVFDRHDYWAFCDHFIRLKTVSGVSSQFIAHYFSSRRVRSQIEGLFVSTAGQKTISQGTLSSIDIPLPPLAEQRRIVAKIEALLERSGRVREALGNIARLGGNAQNELCLLDRLEQSILAKAFRGELVPQDPNDEPASVLLDRIRAERAAAGDKPKRGRRAKA